MHRSTPTTNSSDVDWSQLPGVAQRQRAWLITPRSGVRITSSVFTFASFAEIGRHSSSYDTARALLSSPP